MLANAADEAEAAQACGPDVEVWQARLDDSWLRNSGPTFLLDPAGTLAGAAWRFNAWGEKWPDFALDAALATSILDRLGITRFAAPFVLEGGSIHTDGEGTLLTSEQCLLNPNRNPGLSRGEIERNLGEWLGVERVVWLGEGLENDGTDGHIDNLACFARPGLVLATSCDDPHDANYLPLKDNLARLKAAGDAKGRAFDVVELPIPSRRDTAAGRLAMSYVNFYVANGAVIVPVFDDPMDRVAAERIGAAFPGRAVVQIRALDILEGGGGIHCITQQQPMGGIAAKEVP